MSYGYTTTVKAAGQDFTLWEFVKQGLAVVRWQGHTIERIGAAWEVGKDTVYYEGESRLVDHDALVTVFLKAQGGVETPPAPEKRRPLSLKLADQIIAELTQERDELKIDVALLKAVIDRTTPFFNQMQAWGQEGLTGAQGGDTQGDVAIRYIRQLHAATQAVLNELGQDADDLTTTAALRDLLPKDKP